MLEPDSLACPAIATRVAGRGVGRRHTTLVGWVASCVMVIALAGCATTSLLRDARRAEDRQDYDRAVVEYTRALQRDPDNIDARTGLERARLRAAQDHFARARRLAALGRLD